MKLLIWLIELIGLPNPKRASASGKLNGLSNWASRAYGLRKNFISLMLLALLTGCATSPRTLTPSSINATNTASASISYQGRFAVRYEDTKGQMQNVYGHFVWHETDTDVNLQLLNPLGQILAALEVTPSKAALKLPNRTPQTATNIESLMQQTLGFALPINNLRSWLKSSLATSSTPLPPASSELARAKADTPQKSSSNLFKQDGWTIEYIAVTEQQISQSHTQIRRINLSRETPATQIKLVLDPF